MHIRYSDLVNSPNDPVKKGNDPVNDPVKQTILNCTQQNPKAIYIEIANKTGYSISKIKRHIRELKKTGVIKRIGSEKTGYWGINET